MTFYRILNNIIKISPPTGLLTRSHNRHHYIVPRSRLNTVVYSFYPQATRIDLEHNSKRDHWNYTTRIISSSHKQTHFHHPNSSKMLVTKPHSGIMVLMLSRLLLVSWQCHTVVSDHTVWLYLIYHQLVTKPHSGIIVLMLSRLLPVSWQCHTVVSDHTVPNLSPTTPNHTTIIHLPYIIIQASSNKLSNLGIS